MHEKSKKDIMRFVNFTKLDKTELLKILEMRNLDSIRQKMTNSEKISVDHHLSFCEKLKGNKTNLYMQVLLNDKFVGVMDLQNMDFVKQTYEPGCYFVCNDRPDFIVHASAAISYVCLKLKVYYPNIFIKKDNLQALMFNTMKLKNRIVREDDDYYFLTNDCTNIKKRSLEEIYSDLDKLKTIYEMEFDI